jgi:uncharacterized protein
MYSRTILDEFKQAAKEFRVITVLGPRQAGKTTLCRLAFPDYTYVSLETPDTRQFAAEDPRAFLNQYRRHVILDEVQRVPQLLSYIQGFVDEDQIKAQFILTGSHQLELGQAISQSLAGRTAILTLLPLTLGELNLSIESSSTDTILLNGFMPGKHQDDIDRTRFYRSYFQTYIERDVRQLIQLKDSSRFEKFIQLCAGRVGQLLNQAALANEIGVTNNTINEWLSVLEASFVIVRLQPYFENIGKRLIKSPKLYFIDTGLAAWLLGIENETQMQRDPLRGNLFENMVVMEAYKHKLNTGADPRLYFYRDSQGNEVDLVSVQGHQLQPIEIKSAQTWNTDFLKGLKYFQKLFPQRAINPTVIYGGTDRRDTDSYRLRNYFDMPEILSLKAPE